MIWLWSYILLVKAFNVVHGNIATVSLSDYFVSKFLHQSIFNVKLVYIYLFIFIYICLCCSWCWLVRSEVSQLVINRKILVILGKKSSFLEITKLNIRKIPFRFQSHFFLFISYPQSHCSRSNLKLIISTQITVTCSKSTKEAIEEGMKFVQRWQ